MRFTFERLTKVTRILCVGRDSFAREYDADEVRAERIRFLAAYDSPVTPKSSTNTIIYVMNRVNISCHYTIPYILKNAILGVMKKLWIGISILFLSAMVGGLYFWKNTNTPKNLDVSIPIISPTPVPVELAIWKDQAGFSFSYPKGIVSDIHDEDIVNYAHIEFTHPDHPGTILIWAKDTKVADAAAWVKNEKSFAEGVVIDTTFGSLPGKKILINSPKKKIISGTVDDAIVFSVEGDFGDNDYWVQTFDTITSTFAFTSSASTNAPDATSQGNDEMMMDEEEVLE